MYRSAEKVLSMVKRGIALIIDLSLMFTKSLFLWLASLLVFFFVLPGTSPHEVVLFFIALFLTAEAACIIIAPLLYVAYCRRIMRTKEGTTIGQFFMRLQYEISQDQGSSKHIIKILLNISPIMFFLITVYWGHGIGSIMSIDGEIGAITAYKALISGAFPYKNSTNIIIAMLGSAILLLINIIWVKRIDNLAGIRITSLQKGRRLKKIASIKRLIKYFIILVLVPTIVWKCFLPKQLYINLGDQEVTSRIKVPYWIVVTKNCKKLKEWAVKTGIAQLAIAVENNCPWDKKKEEKYANFMIRGVKLKIPRDELMYGSEPDGKINAVSLHLLYPEMKAIEDIESVIPNTECKDKEANQKTLNPNLIMINISGSHLKDCSDEGVCGKYSCKTKEICDPGIYLFRREIGAYRNEDIKNSKIEMKLIQKNSEYGTDIYTIKDKYTEETERKYNLSLRQTLLIMGENPLEPEYWIRCRTEKEGACSSKKAICYTGYSMANNALSVSYSFHQRQFLPNHFELRKKIEKKLNSYILTNKEE